MSVHLFRNLIKICRLLVYLFGAIEHEGVVVVFTEEHRWNSIALPEMPEHRTLHVIGQLITRTVCPSKWRASEYSSFGFPHPSAHTTGYSIGPRALFDSRY